MDLIYFLKVLYRRKWIILGLSFLAVAATFLLLFNKKPLYESVAQYSTGFTAERVRLIDGTTALDLLSADSKFNNVIETFKSPRVVSRISYRLLLHDLKNENHPYTKLTLKQRNEPVYKKVNRDTAISILTMKLATGAMLNTEDEKERLLIEYLKLYGYDHANILKFMNIRRVDRTDYLDIVFWAESPDMAAFVVNAMGDEFIYYYKNLNVQRSEENVVNIGTVLAQQQRKVDSLSALLLTEKVSQGTIDPVSRSTSAMETVREIETKLAEEKSKKNLSENKLAYLNQRLDALKITAASGSSSDDIVKLTNRKNDLVTELAKRGGNDAALQKELDDVRAEIRKKSGAGAASKKAADEIASINNQINEETGILHATETTISDYESSIRRYMGMTNVNPGSTVKMDVIKDQLTIENDQLKTIKEKYSQVQGLVKDDPTANFIQTRVGQPAIDPESKKTLITMMLAGAGMLFLSSVIFLFIEIFDTSVKTPSIFKRQVKLRMNNALNKIKFKKAPVIDIILNERKNSKSNGDNIFKNNIRKLRHDVMNAGKQIFLITSTQKQTGKTVVTEALAASLLLSKKKVLIIDLNFSNNTLTQQLAATTFIQDLSGEINVGRSVLQQKIVSPTSYENLFIIGCHPGNFTPSEALFHLDMPVFLNHLKAEFDFILIEGAALNFFADSNELSHYAEKVITVFAADNAVTHVDNESFRFIASLGEKNTGVVLNKIWPENINS